MQTAQSSPKISLDLVYEFLLQNAAEGILMIGLDGRLRHINPAAAAMLRLEADQQIGQPIQALIGHNMPLKRLLTPHGPRYVEVRLPNERLATGIAEDIGDLRTVLLHDVTEQRELDSRREALVKTIAHDLRNPLNAVAGYADLVQSLGELNPQQGKFLLRIQQTTQKLYELAAKLVDLSWIEAGMPLAHVPVELTSLTREVMRELSYEAYRKQLSIVNSIPNELPPVMGDPLRLKQTIYNLLDNAIRYTLEPNRSVVIHAWHQEHEVHYTVADRGIGILPSDQDKIWDRMWRSTDERVRDISGGGVGLAFVRTIIQRHGGRITLESTIEEGSVFTFHLPVIRER